MKTPEQLDREIIAVKNYVNGFTRYDPTNKSQARGFLLLEALEWVRGRMRKRNPTAILYQCDEAEG